MLHVLVLCLMSLGAAPVSTPPKLTPAPQATKFENRSAGFKAGFPSAPQELKQPSGERVFSVIQGGASPIVFMVSVRTAATTHMKPEQQLSRAVASNSALGIRVTAQNAITVGGHPAMEYSGTGQEVEVIGRFVLANGQMFHVSVARAPGTSSDSARAFLEAFELMAPAPKPSAGSM